MASQPASLWWAIAGSIAVLALSPLIVAVTGNHYIDAFVPTGLAIIFGSLMRLSRREFGLTLGCGNAYLMALLYPIVVMGIICIVLLATGKLQGIDMARSEIAKQLAIMFVATVIGSLITEEGFFRGWLWGALERSGRTQWITLVWTGIVFGVWHIPFAVMESDFSLPAAVVPIYIANAILIGFIWGILRLVSGSIIVASVSHGVWNALAYILFGFGTKTGALGVASYSVFGPERGYVGLVLNLAAFALLIIWWKRRIVGNSTGNSGEGGEPCRE
jgi:membrane protease YdiL (CAAX protease family)